MWGQTLCKANKDLLGKKCGVIMTYYSYYQLPLKELYFCVWEREEGKMLISSFLPQAMSFHGLLSDKRVHSCSPTTAWADVTAAAAVQCHRLPLSHSPTPSPTLAGMLSAPSQSHFEVITWKKTICYFWGFGGCSFCWEALWSVAGRCQKGPGGAAGEGQGCGQRAAQQRWLWWPAATLTEAAKEPQPSPPSYSFLVRW